MKQTILFSIICFLSVATFATPKKLVLTSPDGTVAVEASLNPSGTLIYEVKKSGVNVIEPSKMGIDGDLGFVSGLKIASVSKAKSLTESYYSPNEKRTNRSFTFREASIKLKNKAGKTLIVDFRATNEGVAFRYSTKAPKAVAVKSEQTTFHFNASARAWLHPHADAETGWAETQPSYEEQYEYDMPVGTKAPQKAGWSFPALFKTGNNWVLISEAGLTPDYVGTRLAQESPNGEYRIGFPQKGEMVNDNDPNYVISKNPVSPWRVIVVGSLATVVESQMVSDMAPAADKNIDFSWVKPGKSSWSWGLLKDDYTTFPVQQKFIEYASKMNWQYCLVDADWDKKIGYEKVAELVAQANKQNVGVLLWYNSSGVWNSTTYSPKGALVERDARRKEFERISKMGVKGVKVDFWPGDGQSSIQYYYDMLKDAADYKLMINFHGTTVPRGWSRTFPNLMTMESIRGYEFITFNQSDADMAAKHITMMSFARNVVGPMDFTPLCLGDIPGKKRRTGNGLELATTVVLQSGIQHFVEIPEVLDKQPDYVKTFLREVPAQWDDVKLLDGYPGKYVVIARRSGNKWYVAGINSGKEKRTFVIDLSFAGKSGMSTATIITEGDTKQSFSQKELPVQNNRIEVEILPEGGFVTVI
ncbi:MAG: glycoside hydrolase family 97 catalytic domain-containing protein [Paludibacter sp.]|nr:glycoside hydrolase family 97 catalytic domain-containing protein [Paludibacter sp.]